MRTAIQMKDAALIASEHLRFATPSFPLRVSAAAGLSLNSPPSGEPAVPAGRA